MRCSLFIVVLLLGSILYCCTTISESEKEVEVGDTDDYSDDNTSVTTVTNESDEPDDDTPDEAEYDLIFNEIKMVIEKLNKIIRNKEYHIWLTYLTEDYKNKKGNTEYLKELSEKPVIKKQNIVLTSLKDYFFYVVVPSRYNAKVDKIHFIDKTHVKAYMYMNDELIILYYLEKQDDEWKIGSW